jgi:hypothetical protein
LASTLCYTCVCCVWGGASVEGSVLARRYIVVKLLLQCCYSVATLLPHCWCTAVTLCVDRLPRAIGPHDNGERAEELNYCKERHVEFATVNYGRQY